MEMGYVNPPMPDAAYSTVHTEEGAVAPRTIDVVRDCYPWCIVWTAIPFCTYLFPFIGHLGIGTSSGEVYEFLGGGVTLTPPGGLSLGPVIRYIQLSESSVHRGTWDSAINQAIRKFADKSHWICFSNDHTFVALCLHEMRYANFPFWEWVGYAIGLWIFVLGKFTSLRRSLICVVPSSIALLGLFILLNYHP